MFLRRKAQSTAEYAITLGLVIAVVTGVLGVALKGGMRRKSAQAMNILDLAGTTQDASRAGLGGNANAFVVNLNATAADNVPIYTSELRNTQVTASNQEKAMQKGGAELSRSVQQSTTTSVTVESLNALNATP